MGRPLRIEYPGALYHITSRGNERRKIFIDDIDKRRFLETPQGNLTKVMHGINGGYTGYFNRRYRRSGHLFQGRYKAILIDKDRYLLELSRYVHLNPVRAKVVNSPEKYRWSSYPGYSGKGKECEWVEYSWILSQFGRERISRLMEIVNSQVKT